MPLFMHEPNWLPRRLLRHSRIPLEWQSWLYNDDSLTARLKSGCVERFRVEVLRQRYARVQRNEALALGISISEFALLREVYLLCGGERMVYARSVIPLKTLTGKQRRLSALGNKPLGGFLFSCPSMQREEIELAEFAKGDSVFARATENIAVEVDSIWGRRSVFRLAGKPLLVAEIFLPGVTDIRE